MKIVFTVFLFFFIINSFSQTVNNNKINTVKELNIYGSNAKIVIGKIIVNESIQNKLFLIKTSELKDSANNYITTFYLGNNEPVPLFNVYVQLKFNHPIISATWSALGVSGSGSGFSANRDWFSIHSDIIYRPKLKTNVLITMTIISNVRIITTISGIDGNLPTID